MRSMLWLVTLFFCWVAHMPGQNNVSLHGGVNLSTVSVPEALGEVKDIQLIHAGITMYHSLSERFRFTGLLQYSQKGHGGIQPSPSFYFDKTRLHYVDFIPVLELKVGKPLGIYAGANLAYLIRADQDTGSSGWNKVETEGIYRDTDIGWVAGGRIYLGNLGIHLHWNPSIQNLFLVPPVDSLGNPFTQEIRNRNLQLGFTYFLQ